MKPRGLLIGIVTLCTASVAACSGGGSSGGSSSSTTPAAPTYTIGGTISGLTAAGLSLYDTISGTTIDTVDPAANATEFTFPTALATGATYAVTVYLQPAGLTCTVANGTGTVVAADIMNVAVTCSAGGGPPAAPTGLAATPGNDQVALTWTADPGAVTYNLYYATTSGAGTAGTKVSGITGTSTTQTGLTNGTIYYFVLTAVNAVGESAASAQASATPAPQPSVTVTNLIDKAVVHTGFVVGTATPAVASITSVQVSLDGGAYVAATGTATWTYKLPVGASTWRDDSAHTIAVRATDAASNVSPVVTLHVRKGVNLDINGDGYADVVVGASSYATVYIYQSAGTAVTSGTMPAQIFDSGSVSFGDVLTVGDVNGDGFADVIVGSTQEAPAGCASNCGTTSIFFSPGAGGFSTTGQIASATANIVWIGARNSFSGDAYAVGDVNGDGFADVAVGIDQFSTVNLYQSAGAPVSSSTVPSVLTGPTTPTASGFGSSLAMGDVNGDGYADLLVGAVNGDGHSGYAYIFNSAGSAGIPTESSTSANVTLTDSLFGFVNSVALGDVNGDGLADVLIGDDSTLGGLPGSAFLYLSAGGLPVTSSTTPATFTGAAAGSGFGSTLALGDVNGDGYADVVVNASSANAVYVYQSTGAATFSAGTTYPTGAASATLTGPASSQFGYSLALIDVTGDGYLDVLVSAYGYNSFTGRVYNVPSAGASGVASVNLSAAIPLFSGPGASSSFGVQVAARDVRRVKRGLSPLSAGLLSRASPVAEGANRRGAGLPHPGKIVARGSPQVSTSAIRAADGRIAP